MLLIYYDLTAVTRNWHSLNCDSCNFWREKNLVLGKFLYKVIADWVFLVTEELKRA